MDEVINGTIHTGSGIIIAQQSSNIGSNARNDMKLSVVDETEQQNMAHAKTFQPRADQASPCSPCLLSSKNRSLSIEMGGVNLIIPSVAWG